MHKLTIPSYAKLNLYLNILSKRKDGYHNINTLFERISLKDKITLELRHDSLIKIKCRNPDVPIDESNLCYKSAKILQEEFNLGRGVNIVISKKIPVGAGLGGGSSNAASVLVGLNRLWGLNLSKKSLINLATEIGSDVPFFIENSSFAIGRGRGEQLYPIRELIGRRLWHLLVVPDFIVSTASVYRRWDEIFQRKAALTTAEYDVKILTSALMKSMDKVRPEFIFNSLQQAAASLFPEIKAIRDKLISLGAKIVLMSGSGSSVFAFGNSKKDIFSMAAKLKRQGKHWHIFVVRTV